MRRGRDDRRREQEREPGRVLVRQPGEQAAAHRRAGAREAWNEREGLRRADEERASPGDRPGDARVVFLVDGRRPPAQQLGAVEQEPVRGQEDRRRLRRGEDLAQGSARAAARGCRPGSCRRRAASRASRRCRSGRCRGRAATGRARAGCAPSRARRTRRARSPSPGASRSGTSGSTCRSGGCSSRAAAAGSRCGRGSRSGRARETPCSSPRTIACGYEISAASDHAAGVTGRFGPVLNHAKTSAREPDAGTRRCRA